MLLDHIDLARVAQIGLLQNEDDVLEPFLVDEPKQLPGRGAPWIDHRKNEQDEVGAGDEIFRDRLVLGHHRVRARRIDDVEVLEKCDRLITLRYLRGDIDALLARPVLEDVDAVGRGQHVDLAEFLAEERVEQ